MALILDGTDGITSSGGTNVLQDDAVITANIANGAVVAAKIADGAVSDAKIANGAVTAAKLAAGAVPAPTTDQVLTAYAGASVGAVGTYAFAHKAGAGTIIEGSTFAGSGLNFAGINSGNTAVAADGRAGAVQTRGAATFAGTWRAMGRSADAASFPAKTTVFLRIS